MSRPHDSPPGVTIVIPAYEEAGAIGQTVASVREVAARLGRPAEVLVVDDGSADETAALAAAAGARVVRHPANGGYGRALLTGIEAATYETVAIVDADGTYPVEHLPALLEFYDRGFDMVVGARQGKFYRGSFGKRALRLVFRFLVEFTCGRSIPDINSGFRVFDRNPVLAVRDSLSPGFSFTTTITLLFMLSNLFVGYVPVPYRRRIGRSKVKLLPDALRSLQIIVTAIAQFNPLKLFLLLLLANLAGNLALAVAVAILAPSNSSAWLVAVVGWNTEFIVMACAILALVLARPKNSTVNLPAKK